MDPIMRNLKVVSKSEISEKTQIADVINICYIFEAAFVQTNSFFWRGAVLPPPSRCVLGGNANFDGCVQQRM